MTNTALGAKKEKVTHTITFKNKEHEKFYFEYLSKCRYQDAYHKALVYCLGIDRDTRNNVDRIYDFKTGLVKTECLCEGWDKRQRQNCKDGVQSVLQWDSKRGGLQGCR